MSDVIQIGDFLMRRKRQNSWPQPGVCQHKSLEYDDNGQVVTCKDCGTRVEAYWALVQVVEQWTRMMEKLRTQADRINQTAAATIHTRAALRVEEAWRKRRMVPSCPHCHRGILPTDGFGSSFVNREMEQRRREIERASKP
jgi:hypothetical protein